MDDKKKNGKKKTRRTLAQKWNGKYYGQAKYVLDKAFPLVGLAAVTREIKRADIEKEFNDRGLSPAHSTQVDMLGLTNKNGPVALDSGEKLIISRVRRGYYRKLVEESALTLQDLDMIEARIPVVREQKMAELAKQAEKEKRAKKKVEMKKRAEAQAEAEKAMPTLLPRFEAPTAPEKSKDPLDNLKIGLVGVANKLLELAGELEEKALHG
jgi:hypothetical protein